MLTVCSEPPSAPINLTKMVDEHGSRVTLLWCSSDVAEEFFVYIYPPVEMKSMFSTSNTSVGLNVLYNQQYNVRVVASNCAGNSTPSTIDILAGKI